MYDYVRFAKDCSDICTNKACECARCIHVLRLLTRCRVEFVRVNGWDQWDPGG